MSPARLGKAKGTLHTDGGARGNPGPAGAGAVIRAQDGTTVAEISEYLGVATNNVAEYRALVLGLRRAHACGIRELTICMDSELVVRQVNGVYRVKDAKMLPLYGEVRRLLSQFDGTRVTHVKREQNKDADKLVNAAIDAHLASAAETG